MIYRRNINEHKYIKSSSAFVTWETQIKITFLHIYTDNNIKQNFILSSTSNSLGLYFCYKCKLVYTLLKWQVVSICHFKYKYFLTSCWPSWTICQRNACTCMQWHIKLFIFKFWVAISIRSNPNFHGWISILWPPHGTLFICAKGWSRFV